MNIELIIIISVFACAVLLCFMLAIANFAGERFFERYKTFDKVQAQTHLTTLEYIDILNRKYFENKLKIVQISNIAGDCYSKGKIFLSTNTINKNSLASFTIISHELGHAKQDKDGNKLQRLAFLRKFGRIIGALMIPLIILGAVLMIFGDNLFWTGIALIGVGLFIFFIALITKLLTISIEKDASKNAIIFLQEILNNKEMKQCKKFLKDARLTYWGDFFRTLFIWTALSKKTKLFN